MYTSNLCVFVVVVVVVCVHVCTCGYVSCGMHTCSCVFCDYQSICVHVHSFSNWHFIIKINIGMQTYTDICTINMERFTGLNTPDFRFCGNTFIVPWLIQKKHLYFGAHLIMSYMHF